jgi:hypothetical protein
MMTFVILFGSFILLVGLFILLDALLDHYMS